MLVQGLAKHGSRCAEVEGMKDWECPWRLCSTTLDEIKLDDSEDAVFGLRTRRGEERGFWVHAMRWRYRRVGGVGDPKSMY